MSSDKLKQTIKDVGDLRESIGAARAKLESLEAQLVLREAELDALVMSVRGSATAAASTPRARNAAPTPPAAAPVVNSAPPPAKAKGVRGSSVAARVLALLNGSPDHNFSTAELARRTNVELRQLYGSLSRLTQKHLIVRVSDGVFRAAKAGGALAA